MKGTLSLVVLLILALAAVPDEREPVVEYHDDGSVRAKYAVDEEGRKHGACTEFFPNGKVAVRATYRSGVLHGSYSSYHEGGRRFVSAKYKAGRLDGKYRETAPDGSLLYSAKYAAGLLNGDAKVMEGKRIVSAQKWKRGRLDRIDGIEPFPRPLAEVREVLAGLDREGDDRERGLMRLKGYRYLAGVAWRDLVLDPALNDLAQAGAELLRKVGRVSHHPENPGLPKDEYERGHRGTTNCNLVRRESSAASVDSYMDDSDPSNIDRLGHRSWCLNPSMGKTGFGLAGDFCAMWAMDGSGRPGEYEMVTFPASGYMPLSRFGDHYAWSVWPNPSKHRVTEGTRAVVYRLNERFVREGPPLALDTMKATKTGRGIGQVVIFRPEGLKLAAGDRFAVVLTGLAKKGPAPWFVVEFVE